MPEQLSQSQIDALLNRLSSGETAPVEEDTGPKVKEYDFKSPKKFTKEQLKALDGLHENFGRMFSSYLSGLLRDFCEIEVVQIEEQSYYEYNNALPDNALIGMLDFTPTNRHYSESFFMMDVSTAIGFLMVERLLGGTGKGYSPTRDFTEIEIALLETIMNKADDFMEDAWTGYVGSNITFRNIETNPRLLQVLAPEDIVVIVMMSIRLGELTGSLSICIPSASLEEVIESFSVRYVRAAKKQDPEAETAKKNIIMEGIVSSDLEVKAVLDNFQMRLKEIVQLQAGDVVLLNKNIHDDVTVLVDSEPWYTAKLGESGMKKSIKLNRSLAQPKPEES